MNEFIAKHGIKSRGDINLLGNKITSPSNIEIETTQDIILNGQKIPKTLGLVGQNIRVNAAGNTLEYSYVTSLTDDAGNKIVNVVGAGDTARLVSVNVIESSDPGQTLVTKDYVSSLVTGLEKTRTVQQKFNGDQNFILTQTPIAGSVLVYINGLKIDNTLVNIMDKTITFGVLGYPLDNTDVIDITYTVSELSP